MYLSNIRRDLKNQRYIADGDQQEKKTINQFKKSLKKTSLDRLKTTATKLFYLDDSFRSKLGTFSDQGVVPISNEVLKNAKIFHPKTIEELDQMINDYFEILQYRQPNSHLYKRKFFSIR